MVKSLFRRQPRKTGTRLFFATDIHGSEQCFRKFLNAAKFYDVSLLVLGGDILGKLLIPILESNGTYSATYGENSYQGLTKSGLGELTQAIRTSGHYYYVGTQEELNALADETHRDRIFRRVACESIASWVALAEERLRGTGCRCFMAPGNDDFFDIDEVLQDSDVVEYAEGRCIAVDGYDMITTGYSNPTPWDTDRELPEPDLKARIDHMAQDARPGAPLIAVLHPPPRDTSIDQAPALDEQLGMSVGAGGVQMASVGSTAVRQFIEERQPVIGLHGHVHEGKGVVRIGGTICINPGSEYTEGVLSGAIVELGEAEVISHQFVAG
jgi:Icc-related predicted phosphoesterase